MYRPKADLVELMARHESEGLSAFTLDPVMSEAMKMPYWKASCGCSVLLPQDGDTEFMAATFSPSKEHMAWLGVTPDQQILLERLDAKVVPRFRLTRWLGRRKAP